MGAAPENDPGCCSHDCFHTVMMRYDRDAAQLVSFRTCDGCGAFLAEVGREHYRPRFERSGEAYFPAGGGSAKVATRAR